LLLDSTEWDESQLYSFTNQSLDSRVVDVFPRMVNEPAVAHQNQSGFIWVLGSHMFGVVKDVFTFREMRRRELFSFNVAVTFHI